MSAELGRISAFLVRKKKERKKINRQKEEKGV
jgi:hypothetical protein